MNDKTYEEEKAERDAMLVQIRYGAIDRANDVLRDADSTIRVFYGGADWAQRKGMALLMDEITQAQEGLLEVIRAFLNPERGDLQPAYQVRVEKDEP